MTSSLLILSIFCSAAWTQRPTAVTCPPDYFQCPAGAGGRPCIADVLLCNGDNDCGDNSDEDPQVCVDDGGLVAYQCMMSLYLQCLEPTGFFGMSEQQLDQKLMNTHLREFCGPVLVAQECATELLASQLCQTSDLNDPNFIELQQTVAAANIAVNHVCRDNVEVFNQHKECLHRLGRDESLGEQCAGQGGEPPCIYPTELVDCVEDVVSQQCGQEIAGQLRTLLTNIMTELGCETHKRFERKKMKMHRVFTGKQLMKKTYSPLELMHKAFPTLF